MNILELDTYNLADAVKFNDQLNPRLWGKDRNLRPDVREHLLQIADDFREFLGVSGYELKDITVSGSNAAYTYTPNSDIDLHLVVDLPQADANEVYRELFDAKKFQYNEQHNISIGGYPVELYVQDANKKHISQGIYSVLNNTWIDIPKRKDTGVDDISTRSKYEDLATRIDTAVKSNDYDSMANLMEKIKTMRQTGLDEHGEFGPENLAFKMLRNQGSIKKLVDARNAAKDRELSLKEREKVKPRVTYGFNTEDATATWDGVSATTQMFLNEKPEPSVSEIVSSFIEYCIEQLSIEQTPIVKFKKDPQWSARNKTFGRYNADQNLLEVSLADRHVMDILRTVAHELTHTRQHEVEDVPDDAGATGSQWENEANAQAGVLMREYAQKHPEFFEAGEVAEGVTSDMRDFFAHGQPDPKLFKSVKPVATVPAENGPADMQKILAKIKNKTPISKDEFAKLKRYRFQQGIAEAKIEEVFDQPYKTKSEKSDYGDVDMLAKLPDGTNLSIMFNREDAKNDVWGVEFYRNNSQEVTGEGDAQRIFATVLTAIQKFIKKKSPQKLFFSASKETDPTIYYEPDEPQPNPASRAKLYDRLVQRYAKELGYRAFRSDTGTLVRYELSRLQPAVAESSGYIPTKKQAKDPRFVMALTKDVKPGATGKEANKLNLQTDSQGHPGLLMTGLANALREFKETGKLPAKLEEEIIDEINMSPSNLAQLTSSSNARAGMEFEMYFPDAAQSNDDYPSEPDYDADENVNRFSDIEEFFRGDYNSRGDVARAIQDLQEEFFEWTEGQISSRFEDDAPSIVYQWVINNVDDDTIIEKMDANEEQYTDDPEYKKKIQQDYADFLLKENDYSDAYDVYSDDERDSIDEGDWFVDNYQSMSDVASETGLTWPYWSDDNGGGTMGLDNIAESFREAIGRPVKASSNYHSTTRDSTSYIIEPDGSLDSPNDSSDGGLEFISPPLPLEEMISDLNKVTKWAVYNNCYTNESTGLHINVSVPGFTREKLDYVKLALLLGDEYVLKEFNREGNYYAKSSMQSIRERVAENPKKAQELLDTMKTNLDGLASKAIHNGDTNKYVSINTKDGYIEFRSPGNDWLGEMAADGTKIENTLRRFVVALSAAIDPTAYREEYLKKLYKLLAPKGTGIDTMMYFAKFVAGELPQGALKSFVRQAQLERKTKKGGDGSEYTAIPSSGTQKYEIQRISDDEIVTAFNAESSADANSIARVWLSDNMLLRVDFRLLRATGQEQAELRQQAQSDTGGIKYDLYNTTTAQVYRTFYAANDGMALDIKRRYHEELRAEDPDVRVGVRRSGASAPTAQSIGFASAPTAQSTGGEFSGQWIIKDGQGRELHRFGGIGNNQSDANRIAAGWLGNNMPDLAGQEIEVVPELLEEGWKDTLGSLAIAGAIGAGGAGGMAAKNAVSGTPTTAPAQTAQVAQGTVKKAPATLKAAPKAAPKAVTPKRVQVQATTQLAGEKLLLKTAIANGISGTELAAFMAQCAHESADFKRMKEYGGSLDFRKYDPKYAPKKAKTLGNKKVGDGAKYKGRGFIQITGRYNYTKAGQELNLPLATHPELVERPDIAAKVAVWFWQHRVQPNVTNFSNVADVTKMINPAMRGLEDRKDNFNDYMQTTVASL